MVARTEVRNEGQTKRWHGRNEWMGSKKILASKLWLAGSDSTFLARWLLKTMSYGYYVRPKCQNEWWRTNELTKDWRKERTNEPTKERTDQRKTWRTDWRKDGLKYKMKNKQKDGRNEWMDSKKVLASKLWLTGSDNRFLARRPSKTMSLGYYARRECQNE